MSLDQGSIGSLPPILENRYTPSQASLSENQGDLQGSYNGYKTWKLPLVCGVYANNNPRLERSSFWGFLGSSSIIRQCGRCITS
jgi:hypothetical protein